MSLDVNIVNDKGKTRAKVSPFGQLITAPLDYSTPIEVEMDTPGVAFNFIAPSAGRSIVITDIIVSASKTVNNTEAANVQIYESDGVDSLTVIKGIVRPQLIRSDGRDLIGLNLLVPPGLWVNATTDDATILLTIMFYRVPV